jgi:hypothetical protein
MCRGAPRPRCFLCATARRVHILLPRAFSSRGPERRLLHPGWGAPQLPLLLSGTLWAAAGAPARTAAGTDPARTHTRDTPPHTQPPECRSPIKPARIARVAGPLALLARRAGQLPGRLAGRLRGRACSRKGCASQRSGPSRRFDLKHIQWRCAALAAAAAAVVLIMAHARITLCMHPRMPHCVHPCMLPPSPASPAMLMWLHTSLGRCAPHRKK